MENIKKWAFSVLLVGLAFPVHSGIYKWTDENGKVHYTQKPPPKDGRRENINTDTFSTLQTVKAPPIPKQAPRPRTQTKAPKKTKVRRSRCNRR